MARPIVFDQANATFGAAQPEYLPMPAHVSQEGEITSCWELDPDELAEVQRTGRVYVTLLAFGRPPQPQIIRAALPPEVTDYPPPPQLPALPRADGAGLRRRSLPEPEALTMDSPREELNELRRQIAAAPKPVQDDIHEAAARIRGVVEGYGDVGSVALVLCAAEFAVQDDNVDGT